MAWTHGLVTVVELVFSTVLHWVQGVIDALGPWGVVLLMAIESANVPLPSEMILPYAGYLVQQGQMNYHTAAWSGALGCVLGSLPSYALGRWQGPAFVQRYGKYLLVSPHEWAQAQRWIARYGDVTFFIARMLPVVRTFISLPAGALNARFWPFVLYAFLGSLLWCYALVYVGVVFGQNLDTFKHYWHQFDVAIALLVVVGGGWYVWRHLKHLSAPSHSSYTP
jgi:membrane protein DedA with SNARE-associated domain